MQESGGPITHDMNSPEIYGTVFSLAPGQEGRQPALGRIGRRPRARHARRRQDLDQRHAAGHARPRPRQPDRRLVVRQRHRLRGGQEDAARRRVAVHLPDHATSARRGRRSSPAFPPTTTCTPCARTPCAAACSTPARSTASTSRSTTASNWLPFKNGLPDVPVTDLVGRGQRPGDRARTAAAST